MTCESDACNRKAMTNLRRITDGRIFACCSRCAEELLARPEWERLT